jgi:hypothetical protein
MTDLAIIIFLLRALVISARLRWAAGLGCALAIVTVWTLLAVTGWYGHDAQRWGLNGAWMLLLLGPSSILGPSSVFPLANAIGPYAVLIRVAVAALALSGVVLGAHSANRYSPISEEIVHWNRGALAFLPPLLLVGGQILIFAVSSLLPSE